MKSGAIVIGLVVSAILLGAAAALYKNPASESERAYREAIALVQRIQLLASNWSVDLARVRSEPLADFDSLASFIPRMAGLKADLREAVRRVPDLPASLDDRVSVYLGVVEDNERRIERFKTGHAVVRNSARYLPLAAANVVEQSQLTGNADLGDAVDDLTDDLDDYLAAPTESAGDALGAGIERLRVASVAYPPPLANALANMLDHAEVLRIRQPPTDVLFRAATSSEISDLSERLVGELDLELGNQQELAGQYEWAMLAIVALLALFWILLALQQRRAGAQQAAATAAGGEEPLLVYRGASARSGEPRAAPAGAGPPEAALAPAAPPPQAALAPEPAGATTGPGAELALEQGFAAECAAGAFTKSAERVSAGVDRLRETHEKVRRTIQNAGDAIDPAEGSDIDEGMESAAAIASSFGREVNGMADLAKRLAAYSQPRDGALDRSMVDIDECIDEVVAALGTESSATVVRTRGDIPEALVSKTEIRLLLAKIVENAMRAVEAAGDREGAIRIDTAARDDDILITVIDNGVGVAPERRKMIFKPFYTSRNGAMGLGLTLADHLAKKYNGGIRVNSLPGQGTMTRITLRSGALGG